MSEEVKMEEPQVQTPVENKPQALGMWDVLSGKVKLEDTISAKEDGGVQAEANEIQSKKEANNGAAKAEPTASIDKADSKTADVESAKVEAEESRRFDGVLATAIAERKKRQALEKELSELRGESYSDQSFAEPQAAAQTSGLSETDLRVLEMSEITARQAHPDYQEKYQVFAEFVQSPEGRPLLDSVLGSRHPGEALYQAGRQIQIQKKYGVTFDDQFKAIRNELKEELVKEIRAEFEAEFNARTKDKLNQPTNLLNARSGTGAGAPKKWQPTSFRDLLRV